MLMAAPGVGVDRFADPGDYRRRGQTAGILMLTSVMLLGIFLVIFLKPHPFRLALVALVGVGSCQVLLMPPSIPCCI
jgi:hypothetical protein